MNTNTIQHNSRPFPPNKSPPNPEGTGERSDPFPLPSEARGFLTKSEQKNKELAAQLREEWGNGLRSIPFAHFATHTWRLPIGPEEARSRINRFQKTLGGMLGKGGCVEHLTFFEPGAGSAWHAHSLWLGTENLTSHRIEKRWARKNGIAKVEVYDPALGGTFYVTKSIGRTDSDSAFQPMPAEYHISDGFLTGWRKAVRRINN